MRLPYALRLAAIAFLAAIVSSPACAQSATELGALRGLIPFSDLLDTPAGNDALKSNYVVTGAIQTGAQHQPLLLPFEAQRQQALRDAFITGDNAFELADGLGTHLGDTYRALTAYTSTDDGKTSDDTSVSPNVRLLIGFTSELTGADSNSAKYYFANETVVKKSVAAPVSQEAADLMKKAGGTTDVMGKAYHLPAGSVGADPYGDSRPFQTETGFVTYTGTDFFGVASSNVDYLSGPAQRLVDSPSFPSGHTTYGYTESLLLAMLVPQRFPQMIVRAAEYGNDRIIIGAHYAMDVLGGRTLALYDVAHLLAGDPSYAGRTSARFAVTDYRTTFAAAKADVIEALVAGCPLGLAACASDDTSRFANAAADEAFYESTQTYGLATVYPANAATVEDVAKTAPEAGYLLTTAFPNLTLAQADDILTATEGPGGGFLDDGSSFGVYSRLDLYKAGIKAAATATGR